MIKEFSEEEIMNIRSLRFHKGNNSRDADNRSEFERDYGRLIHSPAFRRLKGKSQVFGAGSGDYYRERLTHSLEVAQIGRQIARRLTEKTSDLPKNPGLIIDPLIVECAGLGHDIGHPPFGHKGESDLNELIKINNEDLMFEGNAQNFRILTFLEQRDIKYDGLNLTAAILLGLNKYPFNIQDTKKKGVYPTEWEIINYFRTVWGIPCKKATLEAQLMDLSDDIAYSTHDIEDGMKSGKIRLEQPFLLDSSLVNKLAEEIEGDLAFTGISREGLIDKVNEVLTDYLKIWSGIYEKNIFDISIARRELKSFFVNKFSNNVGIVPDDGWYKITFVDQDGNPDRELLQMMIILKKLVWVRLVNDIRVQRLQQRSKIIIKGLWEVFSDENTAFKILPADWVFRYKMSDGIEWGRFIADYISGMTDNYADQVYNELFGTKFGNIYGE